MDGQKVLGTPPILFIFFLIMAFLCTHSPYLGNNAKTYIDFSIIRQPLYPIFIGLFHWAGKYQFYFVMWTQSIITFIALLYGRNWLKKNLQLSDWSLIPVILLVLITISFHYQMISIDDPEGLSFPFFIFAFFNTIECFQEKSIKKIVCLSIWVSVLILLRTQFYFFYGIYIALVFWYFWKKKPISCVVKVALIFIVSIGLTNLADRSYHYIVNGVFINEPFSGLVTVIQPLYLANSDAENYFENAEERAVVRSILHKINTDQLNQDVSNLKLNKIQYFEYAQEEYERSYLPIQTFTSKILTGNSLEEISRIDTDSFIKMNNMTLTIAKKLFLHNIELNISFYGFKIIAAFGGIPYFLFLCLLFFIAVLSILQNRNKEITVGAMFVFLVLLISFFNAMIVAVAEPNCTRYYCYTQFLFYCFAAYIAELIYLKDSKYKP
ncbi:MAG: hypothetical protein A3C44_03395 [Gammaproteobacteria bacterium RIFCSPHIGHO2_02_FULL_39_13]|nr:MAG: hypothetical protein A3C44_03395 [Gammaproteobacteria bacterium RIFCSPHIGHO2_02_FULL_39_13]OGT48575.1 MAG: hypothetical protein A3E53_04285 [Gammaproteobacteria bacterium RIFCSPHIGHO2_12_FULL_39_24]